MSEYLGAARLIGDNGWRTHLHGLEWRNTERFGNRWHNIYIALRKHFMNLTAALETRKMKAIGNSPLGGQVYHSVHHIAAAGHYKSYIFSPLKYAVSRFHKVFGSFLHGNTSQEGDNLILTRFFYKTFHVFEWLNSIVHRGYLTRVLMIFFNHYFPGQVAHCNDMVGYVHTGFFDIVHSRIYFSAATIKVCSMNMNDQWFSGNPFYKYTGRVGEPVV